MFLNDVADDSEHKKQRQRQREENYQDLLRREELEKEKFDALPLPAGTHVYAQYSFQINFFTLSTSPSTSSFLNPELTS